MATIHSICSAENMIDAVRYYGIIPFFKGKITGWSIEELTPPEHWFFSSDELGPWDWKIDVVREGDIAYGKFIGGKAAFATVEFYAHLMNWRRSLPKYRMALGEKYSAKTVSEKMMKKFSPVALNVIRELGAAESGQIRVALNEKKSVCDSVMQFLEMGTWSVTGNFTRVYRGPNAEYTGWQRSSHTIPDTLFGAENNEAKGVGNHDAVSCEVPFWAKFIDEQADSSRKSLDVGCSPQESLEYLVNHVRRFFPQADEKIFR